MSQKTFKYLRCLDYIVWRNFYVGNPVPLSKTLRQINLPPLDIVDIRKRGHDWTNQNSELRTQSLVQVLTVELVTLIVRLIIQVCAHTIACILHEKHIEPQKKLTP